MSETVAQLKFKVKSLQASLGEREKELQQYKSIESEADAKMKALSKMHADKVKSLLNSIQILKKEKASVEGLTKEHKRSKLIQQLNKEINDQDLVIEVLRKSVYDEKGKERGREFCDDIIIKALTKGPQRIRPLTREQLRIQIERLKNNLLFTEKKYNNSKNGNNVVENNSEVSSVSDVSVVNQNEQLLKRMQSVQYENERLKLDVNSKGKVIEGMRSMAKEKQLLKGELEIMVNEVELARRKVESYEHLLKMWKENTNAKMVEVYQREIRVEELEARSKEDFDRLKEAAEKRNVLAQEAEQQRQLLSAERDELKTENQQLMLENISLKKHQETMKKTLQEIRNTNQQSRKQLVEKMQNYTQQINQLAMDYTKTKEDYALLQGRYLTEKAQWLNVRVRMQQKGQNEGENNLQEQMIKMREQNLKYRQLLQGNVSGVGDKLLLNRLKIMQERCRFLQNQSKPSQMREQYDKLFKEYNEMLGSKKQQSNAFKRKHKVQMSVEQQCRMEQMSSDLSNLHLNEIQSQILDNFNSSYSYQIETIEGIKRGKKLTEVDQQLLKLMSSDIWQFLQEDELSEKIESACESIQVQEEMRDNALYQKIRRIKNMNHPQGMKVKIGENEIADLDAMSEGVSVTSAVERQIGKYDSDIDVEIVKMEEGMPRVNFMKIQDMSSSLGSDVDILQDKYQEFVKKNESSKNNNGDKGSRIKIGKKQKNEKIQQNQKGDRSFQSEKFSEIPFDSDVSSLGVNQELIKGVDSFVK